MTKKKNTTKKTTKKKEIVTTKKTVEPVKKEPIKHKMYISFQMRIVMYIILFLLLFILGVYFLINSLDVRHKENITYNENSNINYEVCLNDNEFYEEKCLGKDMSYIANLIDNISLNFNYDFSLSKNINPNLEYEIMGRLVILNSDNKSNYYTKTYTLVNKTKDGINKNSNGYSISKDINIDYKYYNDIATKFKSKYNIDTESYFEVYLTVYNDVPLTYHIPSFSKTAIDIPLSQKSIQIKMDSNNLNNNQNKTITKTEFSISNGIYLISGIILVVLSIFTLCTILRLLRLTSVKKNEYDKSLKNILKVYDRVIVNTSSLPKFNDYNVMKIESFSELLDVRDNLKVPIMFYEVVKHQKAHFYVLFEKNLYLFTLKNAEKKNEK